MGDNRTKHKRCARVGSGRQCVTNNSPEETQRKGICFRVFQSHLVVRLVCTTCERKYRVFGWRGISCRCFLPKRSLHSSISDALATQNEPRGRKDNSVNIRISSCIVCENRNCFEALVHDRVDEVVYLFRTGLGHLPRADVKVVFMCRRLCSFLVLAFRCKKHLQFFHS